MGYTYRLYDSIEAVPREAWMSLRRDEADLFMDPRFLAAIEETVAGRYWSLLVRDEAGRAAASASLCLYPVDAAVLCPPRPRRVLGALRRVWPGCLKFPLVFCGLPFSAGQSHLRLAPEADVRQVFDRLDAALREVADCVPNAAIVCKEFGEEELSRTDTLCELGYVRGSSLPMNCFPPRYGSFDEYCANLRSHYRYKIRRSQRKFARSGCHVAHYRGLEALPHYTDEVHRLYLAVAERAEARLETLPAEFFRRLLVGCGDAVRLTAVYRQSRIVAFAWGIHLGRTYQNLFVGVDYALNSDYDLYFNLMAEDLDQALRLGPEEIYVGQTADVFKSRLGCAAQPRYIYAKGTRWYSAFPLRLVGGLLMPRPASPPARDLFRDRDVAPAPGGSAASHVAE
jgi:predicted N-acyltransferase